MNRIPWQFALWSGLSVLAVALLLAPFALSQGEGTVTWWFGGWMLTTIAGVGGGAWLVSRHGRPGTGFLLALAVCILARLILFIAGPVAAAPRGADAVWACLIGLLAGYLPAQATEVIWFARRTRTAGVDAR